jgi:hypothetical protein
MENNHINLLGINVNDHVEKKGNLKYLSWAWAWAEALKADANATFEVKMFGDVPYCSIGQTCMVWVTVTLFGKPLMCQLPVIDNRNKPIINPDAFAINTSIMRCLAKAVALHGLGLYIYAGEDLPEGEDLPPPRQQAAPQQTAQPPRLSNAQREQGVKDMKAAPDLAALQHIVKECHALAEKIGDKESKRFFNECYTECASAFN